MRRNTMNRWWLKLDSPILGFEGEGDPGTGAGGASGDGGQGTAEGGQGSGSGEGGSSGEGDGGDDPAAGLKSALQKERADRKALEKQLKVFMDQQKAKEDAEKTEVQRLTDSSAAQVAKLEKLASGFRNNAVEAAVLKAAADAKFRDPSDALRAEVLSAIGVEQDEDDPSNVTVDLDTVKDAVKALGKSKPHYLTTANLGGGGTSGSKFGGGGGQRGNQGDARAAMMAKYPALRGRFGNNS